MMKRWLAVLALVVLAGVLSACGGAPAVSMSESNLLIGDVVNGEVVVREVTVANNGDADLVVESVSTSCGCTEATLTPMTIPPGSSGTLSISFDSGAHGPDLTGELIRQVFVNSNDPENPQMIVELTANILAADS